MKAINNWTNEIQDKELKFFSYVNVEFSCIHD